MQIVHSDRHRLHETADVLVQGHPLGSWEVPARVDAILRSVQAAQIGPVVEPADHGLEPILAVHDADYLAFLATASAENASYSQESGPVMTWTFASRHATRKPRSFLGLKGYYAFGWGTPILEGTWDAAYWSAQCALTAADQVRAGEPAAYALCRPPGHHAGADLYGGYCYLNNGAIAARLLQANAGDGQVANGGKSPGPGQPPGSQRSETRVAILDVDYHHGNGTQLIFYADPAVFYASLHVHPDEDYPYYWGDADEIGAGPARGTNRNWPLARGTGDTGYLASLDEALDSIRDFSPRYLVVSVGLDTVEGDPEGGFCLTTQGLHEIGTRICALGLPTVLVQEGGYLLDSLGENAVAFLQPFCG